MIYKWWIFHCHVWLAEDKSSTNGSFSLAIFDWSSPALDLGDPKSRCWTDHQIIAFSGMCDALNRIYIWLKDVGRDYSWTIQNWGKGVYQSGLLYSMRQQKDINVSASRGCHHTSQHIPPIAMLWFRRLRYIVEFVSQTLGTCHRF